MRWGADQWIIQDTFLREWRFWLIAPEGPSGKHVSRWDMPGEPLFHILPQAFDDRGVRDDNAARDLLEIYDALTGSRLALELPAPNQDRRPRLRGGLPQLSRILYGALEAGILSVHANASLTVFACRGKGELVILVCPETAFTE